MSSPHRSAGASQEEQVRAAKAEGWDACHRLTCSPSSCVAHENPYASIREGSE